MIENYVQRYARFVHDDFYMSFSKFFSDRGRGTPTLKGQMHPKVGSMCRRRMASEKLHDL